MANPNSPQSNRSLHYNYIIGLLIVALIAAVTVQWGGIKDLVSYISFALTLSSLLLSVIAIFQGLLSQSSFSSSADTIQDAASKISISTEEIETATRTLMEKVDGLPLQIQNVQDQVAKTHDELIKFASQAHQPNSKQFNSSLSDESVSNFLNSTSLNGLVVIQISVLSHKHTKAFDFPTLIKEKTDYDFSPYALGFFIASVSIGLISADSDQNGLVYTVKYAHPKLTELIDNTLENRINLNYEKNPDGKIKFKKLCSDIKEFFTS